MRRRADREIRRTTADGIVRRCPDCDEFLPENRTWFYYHIGPDGAFRAHTYCKRHEKDRAKAAYQRRRALAGKPQRTRGSPALPRELVAFMGGL